MVLEEEGQVVVLRSEGVGEGRGGSMRREGESMRREGERTRVWKCNACVGS